MTIGKERIEILDAIRTLSSTSEYGLASKTELSKKLNKTYGTVSVMLYRMHCDKLVENPIRGYYKLSEDGMRVLLECISTDMCAEVAVAK